MSINLNDKYLIGLLANEIGHTLDFETLQKYIRVNKQWREVFTCDSFLRNRFPAIAAEVEKQAPGTGIWEYLSKNGVSSLKKVKKLMNDFVQNHSMPGYAEMIFLFPSLSSNKAQKPKEDCPFLRIRSFTGSITTEQRDRFIKESIDESNWPGKKNSETRIMMIPMQIHDSSTEKQRVESISENFMDWNRLMWYREQSYKISFSNTKIINLGRCLWSAGWERAQKHIAKAYAFELFNPEICKTEEDSHLLCETLKKQLNIGDLCENKWDLSDVALACGESNSALFKASENNAGRFVS